MDFLFWRQWQVVLDCVYMYYRIEVTCETCPAYWYTFITYTDHIVTYWSIVIAHPAEKPVLIRQTDVLIRQTDGKVNACNYNVVPLFGMQVSVAYPCTKTVHIYTQSHKWSIARCHLLIYRYVRRCYGSLLVTLAPCVPWEYVGLSQQHLVTTESTAWIRDMPVGTLC